jgi:hypothetical protein
MKLYKHKDCTETAIHIQKVKYRGLDGNKLLVSWWNIVNPDNVYQIVSRDNILIKLSDLSKWSIIEVEKIDGKTKIIKIQDKQAA